jgi:acetyltransferase-like isoleucine patch superfamily enzyme
LSILDQVAEERATADRVEGTIVHLEPIDWPILPRVGSKLARMTKAIWWRSRLAAFGSKSFIARPSYIVGGKSISIGQNVAIHRFGRLEALNAHDGTIRIEIGDATAIQPFAHIGAVDRVTIGRGCLFASFAYVSDHDHDFSDPMDPPRSNGRVVAAPVTIGDYVWLGQRAIVLKGVTIGQRSIIGAGSVVTRDVPEYSIAVGSPARVIRRWDHQLRQWIRADD